MEDTHAYDPTHGLYSSDVAQLNNLHEAPLLDLLRRRFTADDIYVRAVVSDTCRVRHTPGSAVDCV